MRLKHFLATANLGSEPTNWIVLLVCNALLHRNDCVICDLDVLWANLITALCNVTETKTMFFLGCLLTIAQHVQWVHIKLCNTNEETWASK